MTPALRSTAAPFVAAELRPVLAALLFMTAFCGTLTFSRMGITQTKGFFGFFGNLLLAWIPLVLALFIRSWQGQDGWRGRAFWVVCVLWFLFYPNCFYIVTDFIHMKSFGKGGISKWYDILMTSSYAFAGVYLGCLSLFLIHTIVQRSFGHRRGWFFALTMLALSTIGIYVGRFWRLNSWDVLRPTRLWEKIQEHLKPSTPTASFLLLMFLFSVCAYLFFHSTIGLRQEAADAPPR